MLRRTLLTAILLIVSPALACAWTITSKAMTVGGTITPVGTVNLASTTTSASYLVTPNANFSVAKVTLDGVTIGTYSGTYTVTKTTASSRTILAFFTKVAASVTVTPASGGVVSATPTGNVQSGTTVNITAAPNYNYLVTAITVNGDNILSGGPYAVNQTVTASTVVSGSTNITASFAIVPRITASMFSSPSGTYVGSPSAIILDATNTVSNVQPLNYTFNVPAGFSVSDLVPQVNGKKLLTNATTAGSYAITVTAEYQGTTSTSAPVTITVRSANDEKSRVCTSCHAGRDPDITSLYSNSKHMTVAAGPSCQDCHDPGMSLPHPGIVRPFDSCQGCHVDGSGNVANHPIAIGTTTCVTCHNPHSTVPGMTQGAPHYNNNTSVGYAASYVTSRATCKDCHFVSDNNKPNRLAWALSGHGLTSDTPWRAYDFKTMSGCVQCHTTTGFIAYSTGKVTKAWGTATDKTKEVLSCIGCHTDINTGAIRTVTPVRPYADDSYINKDVGKSNICMDCHIGTKNGSSIAKLAVLANVTSQLVQPHYLAAGGILHGKAGYQMSGRSYGFYSTNTHRTIGIGNVKGTGTAGPCIACHKDDTSGHSFKASASSLCAYCHGGTLDQTKLSADKVAFTTALEILKAELAARGFTCSAVYPYFGNKNWGTGQAGADTMGAAFNYVLLANEPGAYAHNSAYAKQLVLDAIDYLDDGLLNNSVESTVQGLVGNGISQEQADRFTAYKNATVCNTCHGGPANTSAPMATNAHAAHLTGAYGPGNYLGNDVPACQACHPYPTGHLDGTVEVLNGAGSKCAGCHPGTLPAWAGGVRLTCISCHGTPPSVLPNTVAAPAKPNFTTTGHGPFSASSQCTNCHDGTGAHISGSLGVNKRLLLGLSGSLNAECTYCHNDPVKVSARFRNMSTHVTAKGGGQTMACAMCHDPHGTINLSMIRTTINGQTITYSDRSAGLVNTVTNQGLCQVCHTLTAHFIAGIAESSHPTTNCLSCHSHNAAGAAFKPNGTCDACHGYPPAPRGATFGTLNNWSSARFEDYSGGGGAHLVGQHVPKSAKPSEGWANCAVCHNGGVTNSTPYHRMTMPLTSHVDNVHMEIDQKFRFAEGFAVYTGAKLLNPPARNVTGSCFNVSCHLRPSPKWSIER